MKIKIKKLKRYKPFTFFVEDYIYRLHICVVVGGEKQLGEDAICRAFRWTEDEKTSVGGGAGRTLTHITYKDVGIWLQDPTDVPTLSHEANHATFHILRASGLKFSEDSEEAYTYHQAWLVSEILRGIRGHKGKRK